MSTLTDLLSKKSPKLRKEDGSLKTSGELLSEVTDNANLVDNKQTWEYALSHKDNLDYMKKCCDAELETMNTSDVVAAPYFFERVAILCRKKGDYEQEILYCERYIKSVNQLYKKIGSKHIADVRKGPRYIAITKRLPKAKALLAKKKAQRN